MKLNYFSMLLNIFPLLLGKSPVILQEAQILIILFFKKVKIRKYENAEVWSQQSAEKGINQLGLILSPGLCSPQSGIYRPS